MLNHTIVEGEVTLKMAFSFLLHLAEREGVEADGLEAWISRRVEEALEVMFTFGQNEGVTNLYQALDSIEYETVEE